MIFASVSLIALLGGGALAAAGWDASVRAQARCELAGGGLLATGLMLIGVGLQSLGG